VVVKFPLVLSSPTLSESFRCWVCESSYRLRAVSPSILLALGQHFALHGQVDLFATQILISLRGDSRPQLGYRIDTLLDLLAREHSRSAASPSLGIRRASAPQAPGSVEPSVQWPHRFFTDDFYRSRLAKA